jgi:hypothetical protein
MKQQTQFLFQCRGIRRIQFWAQFLCLLVAPDLFAAQLNSIALTPIITDVRSSSSSSGSDMMKRYHLVVQDANLNSIVEHISRKTGVKIHYSVLPENMKTLKCTGTIHQLLSCLLGPNLSMAVSKSAKKMSNQRIDFDEEIWLVGEFEPLSTNPSLQDNVKADTTVAVSDTEKEQRKVEYIDKLLEMVKDPKSKVQALAGLANAGNPEDMTIRQTLKQALSDENSGVRSQALFALVRREGEESATEALKLAMQDKSADVRRMAVESTRDWSLLQQALQDDEPSIRQFAETKIKTMGN